MQKKVLIFIPSIEVGGVEKNLFEVSNYLNKKKINLEILTCNNNMSVKFSNGIKFIGTKNTFWHNRYSKKNPRGFRLGEQQDPSEYQV